MIALVLVLVLVLVILNLYFLELKVKNSFLLYNINSFNISVTFITSNNDSSSGGSGGGCTNDQCKQLMKFLKLKIPWEQVYIL